VPGPVNTLPPAETLSIPEDMLAAIEALPDKNTRDGFPFTEAHDAILLNYWNVKPQNQLCRIIGCSENTARRRYNLLTRGRA
jgi:hypothetical protein